METQFSVILTGQTLPKVKGRGRPKGSGCNLHILEKLGNDHLGNPKIAIVSERKMKSIRTTAAQNKIKIKVRQWDNQNYAIEKVL